MIGLSRETVKLVPYTDQWKEEYNKYVQEYSELKNRLAGKYEDDRSSYTSEKNSFISMILEKAIEIQQKIN